MDTYVWGKIREETANAHKTRRKPKPIPIASKEPSGNKKTMSNKVARAKPTHQSKRTKWNVKNKMPRNSKRRLREGTETKKSCSGLDSTLTPKAKARNCNETSKNVATRENPQTANQTSKNATHETKYKNIKQKRKKEIQRKTKFTRINDDPRPKGEAVNDKQKARKTSAQTELPQHNTQFCTGLHRKFNHIIHKQNRSKKRKRK